MLSPYTLFACSQDNWADTQRRRSTCLMMAQNIR
jgi:hypothetical protein